VISDLGSLAALVSHRKSVSRAVKVAREKRLCIQFGTNGCHAPEKHQLTRSCDIQEVDSMFVDILAAAFKQLLDMVCILLNKSLIAVLIVVIDIWKRSVPSFDSYICLYCRMCFYSCLYSICHVSASLKSVVGRDARCLIVDIHSLNIFHHHL
jgi:hypothetical protein